MWSYLADRLILRPSRHTIAFDGRRRRIGWSGGDLEVAIQNTRPDRDADALILKFAGAGGRAERSSVHPADCWPELPTEIWTVNPPGYGRSDGRASLRHIAEVARVSWQAAETAANGRPILVTGNSLGTLSAILLAAEKAVAGVVLRNPVALREVIRTRFGWVAHPVARQVPAEVCPLANAPRALAPAVIVSSQQDRVVPPEIQRQLIERYGGPTRVLPLADADHADPPSEAEQQEYCALLDWLRREAIDRNAADSASGA